MYLEGQYTYLMPSGPTGHILPYFIPNQSYLESPTYNFSALQCSEEQKTKENYPVKQIGEILKDIQMMQQKIKSLESQNCKLKKLLRPKRHYSKRRSNLQKCYGCPYSSCNLSYSSKIALSNHIKKKHKRESTEPDLYLLNLEK